jgi:hypothetical protein
MGDYKKMTKCPICFKKADYTTSCNHTFCKKCLYKWCGTCPLCRKKIALEYPNTRAMSNAVVVREVINIILKNIRLTEAPEIKLKFADKLFNFIWDNRIIIRKNSKFCRIIHKKSVDVEQQCLAYGFLVPKILKKTAVI